MLNRKNRTFRFDNNLEGPRRSDFDAKMRALTNAEHEQIDGMFPNMLPARAPCRLRQSFLGRKILLPAPAQTGREFRKTPSGGLIVGRDARLSLLESH